jgi:nucleoid-associated protein YgaU
MKKFLCVMAVFLPVFLTSACESAPAPVPDNTPPPAPAATPTPTPTPAATESNANDEEAVPIVDVEPPVISNARSGIIVEGAREYTVKYGDTLVNIARRYYGRNNGYYFPLIMAASQLETSDPDKIIGGQNLKIPDLTKNLDDPQARAYLKSLLRKIANAYVGKANATSGSRKLRYQKDSKGLVNLSETL